MRALVWVLVLLVSASLFVGASAARGLEPPQPPVLPVSLLTIDTAQGRFSFSVEVAATSEARMRGLQDRRWLPSDAGMLFDFQQTQPVAMWMKNTFIPLDMLFIDEGGRVRRIARDTVPHSLEVIGSGVPVRAVLELNAGSAARIGVVEGDRVCHPLFGCRTP